MNTTVRVYEVFGLPVHEHTWGSSRVYVFGGRQYATLDAVEEKIRVLLNMGEWGQRQVKLKQDHIKQL